MSLFDTSSLNDGVRKREVFGWAMYDFANSGYTTVVMTAVFNAYFIGVVAANASWATLAWTSALALSSAVVMLTMPSLGALADLRASKKRMLAFSTAGCVLATALLALAGPGDLWLAICAIVLSNIFYSYGESLNSAFLPELARREALGRCPVGAGASVTSAACSRSACRWGMCCGPRRRASLPRSSFR